VIWETHGMAKCTGIYSIIYLYKKTFIEFNLQASKEYDSEKYLKKKRKMGNKGN
jgi:hypothetical protein